MSPDDEVPETVHNLRVRKAAHRLGVKTWRDFSKFYADGFLELRNVGPTTVARIQRELERRGLSLLKEETTEQRVLRRVVKALREAEGGHFTLSTNTLNAVADALEKEAERG